MLRRIWTRVLHVSLLVFTMALITAPALAAEPTLDDAIETGFGKLVKYGRWAAALLLAVVFCLAWAERGQNPDNPHEVNKGTKKMIWSGAGFVAVIGYKVILSGLVSWFGLDPAAIPSFLWQ